MHEFVSLQEGLPFSGDPMDFGPVHFICPAHRSLFLLYAPSLALPSHLCVLPCAGALCCVTLCGFAAVPACRRNWLTQRWCSLHYEVLGWLWAPSVSSCFTAGFQSSLQWYLSHGLTQTSVAATSSKTALHNQFAVGNLCSSLVSSSDFFCVQGIYLQTWWFCWAAACVQLFPACVCESLITPLLDKQAGEGISIAWLVTPAVLPVQWVMELTEPVFVSGDAAPQHQAGAPKLQVTV